MSASVDAITSLKSAFPSVTDRLSSDCPAVNVPTGELISVLKSLRDERASHVKRWICVAGAGGHSP